MKLTKRILVFGILATMFMTIQPCFAGLTSKAAKEVGEMVMQQFGKTVGKETAETIAEKTVVLATKYGDDVAINAVKKIGPKAFRIVEEAGEHGNEAVRLLAKYGDDAVLIAEKKSSLGLVTRYGDDAATALIRHGEIAEPVVDAFGKSAATALSNVSKQNGRRIVQMLEDGDLAKTGVPSEMLDVVGKYGDKAMEFIWRNKVVLAGTAIAVTFVRNPEPYIDGVKELGKETIKTGGEMLAKPLAEEVGRRTNWTRLGIVLILVVTSGVGIRSFLKRDYRNKHNDPEKD